MSSENESFSENEVEPNADQLQDDAPLEGGTIEDEATDTPQADEDKKDSGDESKKKVVKPKRVLKNPLPRFNERTIQNVKGLPAIIGHFKNVKFKGRGYEEQDLNLLMKTYEYWSHRFFPKYTFDDTITRLEWLGRKRGTKIYLRKMRMGMEEIAEDMDRKLQSDDEIPTEGFVEPFDDQFDQLLSTNARQPEPKLTEEQLERIEQNRLRAEALRRDRMSRIGDEASHMSNVTSQNDGIDQHNAEIDLDNILDMINEDNYASTSSSCINKETFHDKNISSAIRKNDVTNDNESIKSDDSSNLQIQPENRNKPSSSQITNEQMNDNSSDESDTSSSDKSITFRKNKKSTQNSQRQKKKWILSESDEDSDDISHISSVVKKKNVFENDDESLRSSQSSNRKIKKRTVESDEGFNANRDLLSQCSSSLNKTSIGSESVISSSMYQKKRFAESDEDSNDNGASHSQNSSLLKKVNNFKLNSGSELSQSASKPSKKRTISDSDEDSNDTRPTPSTSRSKTQTRNKKKRTVVESDDNSNDTRDLLSQTFSTLKKTSLGSGSESVSSQNSPEHRKMVKCDEDSDIGQPTSQSSSTIKKNILGSDSDDLKRSQNSAKQGKEFIMSESDKKSMTNSQDTRGRKKNINSNEKESVTGNATIINSNTQKKRRIVESDASDEGISMNCSAAVTPGQKSENSFVQIPNGSKNNDINGFIRKKKMFISDSEESN